MEGTQEQPPAWEVTELDHENGFKVLTVELRSGKTRPIKFTAPSHRVAQHLAEKWNLEGDADVVVHACLPPGEPQNLLDTLEIFSAGVVKIVCVELTFGAKELKKKLEMGAQLVRMLAQFKSGTGGSTKHS
jgi:hypothetical protein